MCLSVDATFKDTDKSDKVAIHVWGKLNADFYLVDRINARMDFTATLQAIRNMLKRHPRISLKLVEDKANGSAIISVLNREIGGFVGVNPEGGK
jgi:predicted phage terminase large subunit-like protein